LSREAVASRGAADCWGESTTGSRGVAFYHRAWNALNISLSDLIQNATDPDHDVITFQAADTASTNGATVEQMDAYLVYTPLDGFAGTDRFNYTISDPTTPAQGTVTIDVGVQAPP